MADNEQRRAQRKPRVQRTGIDASLILMTGFFAVLGGLGLCLGPRLSWKMAQIAEGFAHLGLFGGTFLMSGLILVVMGTLRRGQQVLQRELWQVESSDDGSEQLSDDVQAIGQIVEDIAARIANVTPSVQASVDQSLGSVRDGLNRLGQLVQSTGSHQESDDAVFRMAASLDQLGARLEGQFKSRVTELENRIETLQAVHDASIAAIQNVSQSIESLRDDASSAQRDVLARFHELHESVSSQAQATPAAEPVARVAQNAPVAPAAIEPEAIALEPDPPQARKTELALEPESTPELQLDAPAPIEVENVSAALPTAKESDASPFDLASRAHSVEDGPSATSPAALPKAPAAHVEPVDDSSADTDSLREALERMRNECDAD